MYSCNVILSHVLAAVCVSEHFYTMSHKKGATLFSTITLETGVNALQSTYLMA